MDLWAEIFRLGRLVERLLLEVADLREYVRSLEDRNRRAAGGS